jgi:hypothetical protein
VRGLESVGGMRGERRGWGGGVGGIAIEGRIRGGDGWECGMRGVWRGGV